MDFEGIAEFVAVAETQGFTSASRKLGVSASHVSRQVAALESQLGVALFARSTRRVRMTDAGYQYFLRCRELLNGLIEANEMVAGERVALTGTLRVSVAGEFAERYVVPQLIEFTEQHPELALDVNFNSQMVDFIEEGYDFSVRFGKLQNSNLVARKLVDRRIMAAASSGYLRRYGEPKHPEELTQHKCIVGVNDNWVFQQRGELLSVRVQGKFKSNSGRSLVRACERDFGICYMPMSSFGDALRLGHLKPVLEPFWHHGKTTSIVYANRKFLPNRARLAIDHLIEHFTGWEETYD